MCRVGYYQYRISLASWMGAFLSVVGIMAAPVELIPSVHTNYKSDLIGTYQGITFYEGGFSGLFSIPGTSGKEFYTLSDRGVNVDSKNATCTPTYDKIFPFPTFAPKIHKIKLSNDSIIILESMTIKRPNGSGATGLMNPTGFGSTSSEKIWKDTVTNCDNVASVIIEKDTWGIDGEGIAIGKNNDFWICEEGGASVWNVDNTGKVKKRYTPYANLPGAEPQDIAIDTVFKYRKNNRGFEGLAITPNGKIYALIQSAILYPNKSDGEKSLVHRLLEIDPSNNQTKMYAYLNPGTFGVGTDTIKAKDWKIGDLSAINDSTFLVIEQGVVGANVVRKIFEISTINATPVTSALYNGKTLEQLKDSAGLAANSIVPVKKTLFMDLLTNTWPKDLDKAEGLAIINDSTIAIANDNDFGQYSPNENGIAIPNNVKTQLYIYKLTGENKIKNLTLGNEQITSVSKVADERSLNLIVSPYIKNNLLEISLFHSANYQASIYTVHGNLIKQISFSRSTSVPLLVESGVYFLKIVSLENERVFKIIKK